MKFKLLAVVFPLSFIAAAFYAAYETRDKPTLTAQEVVDNAYFRTCYLDKGESGKENNLWCEIQYNKTIYFDYEPAGPDAEEQIHRLYLKVAEQAVKDFTDQHRSE